jgi:hypothetical protein
MAARLYLLFGTPQNPLLVLHSKNVARLKRQFRKVIMLLANKSIAEA